MEQGAEEREVASAHLHTGQQHTESTSPLSAGEATRLTFAEKLELLFKAVTRPDGEEYTHEEVQEGTGRAVTAGYIWRLRTGRARNPSYKVIKALSHFFGVSPSYFFDEEVEEEHLARLELARRLREENMEKITLGASELDEASRFALLEMIERLSHPKGGDTSASQNVGRRSDEGIDNENALW